MRNWFSGFVEARANTYFLTFLNLLMQNIPVATVWGNKNILLKITIASFLRDILIAILVWNNKNQFPWAAWNNKQYVSIDFFSEFQQYKPNLTQFLGVFSECSMQQIDKTVVTAAINELLCLKIEDVQNSVLELPAKQQWPNFSGGPRLVRFLGFWKNRTRWNSY